MKKLKKFWSKLKYWQKGGLIGFLLGVVYLFFLFPNDYIFGKYTYGVLFYLGETFCGDEGTFFFGIICELGIMFAYFLVYIIIGALIGLIIKKLKKK